MKAARERPGAAACTTGSAKSPSSVRSEAPRCLKDALENVCRVRKVLAGRAVRYLIHLAVGCFRKQYPEICCENQCLEYLALHPP
jgi:hypothetical protein